MEKHARKQGQGRRGVRLAGGALFAGAVAACGGPPAVEGAPCITGDLTACAPDLAVLRCEHGTWTRDSMCTCTPTGQSCAIPGFVGVDRARVKRRKARRVRASVKVRRG